MAAPQDARSVRQMEILLGLAKIAAETMQCLCILDDIDDTLADKPHLVEEAGINMAEVDEALQILRRLGDSAATATARLQTQFQVVEVAAGQPDTREAAAN